jgi:hypothetical protein
MLTSFELQRVRRSYDNGDRIEDPKHVEDLLSYKLNAQRSHGMGLLGHCVPESEHFFQRAAHRGVNLGGLTKQLLDLMHVYGAQDLRDALAVANERDIVHVPIVRQHLEQVRHARNVPVPLSGVELTSPRLQNIVVRPHELQSYGELSKDSNDVDK